MKEDRNILSQIHYKLSKLNSDHDWSMMEICEMEKCEECSRNTQNVLFANPTYLWHELLQKFFEKMWRSKERQSFLFS